MAEACKVLEMQNYMKLPVGTVINGTVTVDDRKIAVEVTVGQGSPSLTAIEHLSVMQAQLNGQAEGEEIVINKGVIVEKIDLPDGKPKRILSGTYWRTIEGKQEDSVKRNRTLLDRILSRLGLGQE
jgi:hypothetical protein